MAKGDTKTNQYLDIAANGTRADLPTDTCCETRTQTLIRGVAERIMDVEDEVEEIKNNPDVVDIVPTYAALQNYDTSSLTDKDIIRVLQDETHDGDSTYYRYNAQSGTWTYVGESKQYEDFVGTDGTAGGQNGLVPAPVATDAGKFLNANGSWEEVQAGGVIELTTADYNYPTNNPTQVSLYLLDPGIYTWGSGVVVRAGKAGSTLDKQSVAVVENPGGANNRKIWVMNDGSSYFSGIPNLFRGYTIASNGNELSMRGAVMNEQIVNNLTSTSTANALSANQGRVLKGLIDSLAIRGAGAPTTSTAGEVGQLYEDGTNGALYQLKSIDITVTPNTYNWEQVGGGSGPTVVQTTGTSATDVMSQNAVTSMVFNDPSTRLRVQIGASAQAGSNADNAVVIGAGAYSYGASSVVLGSTAKTYSFGATALGTNAYANADYSIALGDDSTASAIGEMAIGTKFNHGYNNSNYRLLTGLYDGQSAHDAATVGQITPLTDSTAPTTATVGTLGKIYIDTSTATAYMCVEADTATPSYTWKQITA